MVRKNDEYMMIIYIYIKLKITTNKYIIKSNK